MRVVIKTGKVLTKITVTEAYYKKVLLELITQENYKAAGKILEIINRQWG